MQQIFIIPRILCLSICLFFISYFCSAENEITAKEKKGETIKITVVDMNKLFNEYYKTKLADINLKKQTEIFKSYARKLFESKMKLEEEFKKLRDASQNIALSEAERESKRLAAQDKYRQLKEKEAELREYNTEKQKQIRKAYDKQRDIVVNEITEVIRKRATLEGYGLVIDISGRTLNNIPAILYYSEAIDITSEILKILNRGHEKELEMLEKDGKNRKATGNAAPLLMQNTSEQKKQ